MNTACHRLLLRLATSVLVIALGSVTRGAAAPPADEAAEQEAQRVAERAHAEALATMRVDEAKIKANGPLVREPLPTGRDMPLAYHYGKMMSEAEACVAAGNFNEASILFARAQKLEPPHTLASDRELKLKAAIAAGLAPITVMLVSDGRTLVSISSHRFLGRFKKQLLELPPGNYTILGRRKGCANAVVNLEVVRGALMPTATVICR